MRIFFPKILIQEKPCSFDINKTGKESSHLHGGKRKCSVCTLSDLYLE